MPVRLVDRWPRVPVETLVAGLVPPPLFAGVSFAGYRPDPAEPSQTDALAAVTRFAGLVRPRTPDCRGRWRSARRPGEQPAGIYLDGGFGVGKTHLLAALWHAVPGPKAYATFLELTQLVGALGFAETVARLAPMTLLAIDEFELDDPGDTVLVSSLLARLDATGVRLAATSNTLPDRLGEQRFAAADFDSLLAHLARLHPSRYGALLDGIGQVCLTGVTPAPEESVALRLVVLADRLYDRQLPLACSGAPLDRLFGPDMLAGGYRAKYRRAISRLVALARLAAVPT